LVELHVTPFLAPIVLLQQMDAEMHTMINLKDVQFLHPFYMAWCSGTQSFGQKQNLELFRNQFSSYQI
jgi:hypothetical protein